MLSKTVILLTLLGVCFGSPDGIEQRVEVTKTAQQAIPAIAYGLDGFPYASQVVRPVQVKTTTTHRTEAAPLHAPANVAAHVAAAPVAAPVVQTNVVASAPVVATSPVYTSPYVAGWPAYHSSYVSAYPGYGYWPHTASYVAPVATTSHVAAPLVSYPSSVYGYSLVSPYSNYLLLKKKK